MTSSELSEKELRARAVDRISCAIRVVEQVAGEGREETAEEATHIQEAAVGAVTDVFVLRHRFGTDAGSTAIREIEALGEMQSYLFWQCFNELRKDYEDDEEGDDAG